MVALIFCIALFIINDYTIQANDGKTNEKESRQIKIRARFNWRVFDNCWKFHIIPAIRLKYKRIKPEDNLPGVYSRFDITLGWLFAFIRIEFEK